MARITYPGDFASRLILFASIKAKHEADGAASPLTAYLAQHDIDLAAGETAVGDAEVHETSRALLRKQSENFRELRDHLFNPVFNRFQKQVQFLKSFYKGNAGELANWGITVTGAGRIDYPTGFAGRMQLLSNFVVKHNSFPAGASPLQPFLTQQGINLFNDLTNAEQAAEHNTSFNRFSSNAENEKQQRDVTWMPVAVRIRSIGDYLKKLHTGTEKKLGLWGFTVDDSPRKPKLRTSTVKPGEQITTVSVILGSTLTNIGTGDLHVYKGKTTAGTPAIVAAGEQLGMVKGYSVTTVANPSTIIPGKFTVLVGK